MSLQLAGHDHRRDRESNDARRLLQNPRTRRPLLDRAVVEFNAAVIDKACQRPAAGQALVERPDRLTSSQQRRCHGARGVNSLRYFAADARRFPRR